MEVDSFTGVMVCERARSVQGMCEHAGDGRSVLEKPMVKVWQVWQK